MKKRIELMVPPLVGSFALMGAGLLLIACPGGAELENKDEFLSGGGDGDGDGPCDPTPIIEANCSSIVCHQGTETVAPSGAVELFAEGFEADLIDMPAAYPVEDPENCPETAELYVDTTSPEESLMLTKLNGNWSCGNEMPWLLPALSESEIECFREWIYDLAGTPFPGAGAHLNALGTVDDASTHGADEAR